MTDHRQRVLYGLARLIVDVQRLHPIRVAVDGVDAAGKTTLADELAPILSADGRAVIRASIDGFHRPRAERYRRGVDSPEGYYLDSFDHDALRRFLLVPLGPGGDRLYRCATFDFRTDTMVDAPPVDAILLFDGVFLLRPDLNDCWDFRIFVDVDFEETVRRARARDLALFGSAEATLERYRRRYVPGQRIYLETVCPRELADVIVENGDPARPRLVLH